MFDFRSGFEMNDAPLRVHSYIEFCSNEISFRLPVSNLYYKLKEFSKGKINKFTNRELHIVNLGNNHFKLMIHEYIFDFNSENFLSKLETVLNVSISKELLHLRKFIKDPHNISKEFEVKCNFLSQSLSI